MNNLRVYKSMKKNNFAFMAFASGKESTEVSIKRYIGVAPVFVLSVNPNKAEMEKLFSTTLEEAPNYVGETEVGEDKHKVANARVTFIVKPDAAKVGMEVAPISLTLFVRNEVRYNKDNTKVQVIDKYGRTAWVTVEQAKVNEIPVYSNGPARIDKGYRPALVGEPELIDFLKCYLNIPNVDVYNSKTKEWSEHKNPTECEASLENIASLFKGDFTELQEIIKMQPNNKVKVLFGVRTTDDNKLYQAAYTQKFLKNNVTDYSKLDEEVQSRKQAGAYSTTEFEVCDFKEYTVASSSFDAPSAEMPFPPAATPWS